MFSIITIYTNAAVIVTMAIVVIKIFTHYMSIATKTMTEFLKSLKKEHRSLIFYYPKVIFKIKKRDT